MKTLFKINTLWIFALVMILGACGNQVPGSFRGDYVDNSTGATLKLNADSGEFLTPDGRLIKAKRQELDAQDLINGKAGIYTRLNPINKELLELYWVQPVLESRQSAGGIVWYTSEIIFMRLNTKTDNKIINEIQLIHSTQGSVMIDQESMLWQVGWPAASRTLVLRRR